MKSGATLKVLQENRRKLDGVNTYARLFQNLRLRYHTFARLFCFCFFFQYVCATFFPGKYTYTGTVLIVYHRTGKVLRRVMAKHVFQSSRKYI